MYQNIGGKIKGFARAVFIVSASIMSLGGLVMISGGIAAESAALSFTGLAVMILGVLVSWLSTWLLYGFGELIEKTSMNEENTRCICNMMLDRYHAESPDAVSNSAAREKALKNLLNKNLITEEEYRKALGAINVENKD